MSNQQINDISDVDHNTSVIDHFKLWNDIIEANKNQLSEVVDCLDGHSSKSLNEDGLVLAVDVVCSLVLIKRGNKFLGVSRKYDHNDIGLPGGKCERGESFEDCARREATEETDFIITLLQDEPFKGVYMGLYCQTYLAEITGKVSQARDPSETGIVDWFDKQAFIDGTFGQYTTKMFEHFGHKTQE